ncbi:arginine deiminase family protein [Aeromicrobium sp. UC242_57]|uniref:arginine deiminase family protein n=1 Tax=Aeromicrobium sp. UC242_57 TaxID=3374624 RepID=UPI00379E3AEC
MLFDGIPWVGRAQNEHDAFAQALRDHDVEVLYLADLLTETLAARCPRLGHRRHDQQPAARRQPPHVPASLARRPPSCTARAGAHGRSAQ